jgi:hypothetical protein
MMDDLEETNVEMLGYQCQLAGFVVQSRNADEERMGVRVCHSW